MADSTEGRHVSDEIAEQTLTKIGNETQPLPSANGKGSLTVVGAGQGAENCETKARVSSIVC